MESLELQQLIKAARHARLWSVRRLARESGLSAGYISQLESGTRPFTPRSTGRIADTLRIPTYELLSVGGFIPAGHLDEAKRLANAGMEVPSILGEARGDTPEAQLDWLIIDYLYLLGDDPYGTGWDGGPGGHHADWTPLVPDAPRPFPERIRPQIEAWRESLRKAAPSPIEGWDELTDADRTFIQHMVNKLRRPASGDPA